MDKPPAKTKPNAKQDDAPDEPDADAQERMARLRQLADDYAAAFHRKPNPEDYKMARKLREISRPKAINTALKNPLRWERETWIGLIPIAIKQEDGDSLAVARVLIAVMPASLRAKCASYPGCPGGKEDWDAFEARAKEVAAKIHDQVQLGKHCGPLDTIKIGRAVLTALRAKRADEILPYPED